MVEAMAGAMEKEPPPSLSEPLVNLNTGGMQNLAAWVHNLCGHLAANIEAQRERSTTWEQELRAEGRLLRDRLGNIEARQMLRSSPTNQESAEAVASPEPLFVSEVRSCVERVNHLESSFEHLREQLMQSTNTQSELDRMRFETIELELTTCLRPKDLDGYREEVDAMRRSLEQETSEQVRSLNQQLQADLQTKAGQLRKDLKTMSDVVTTKLQLVDEQIEAALGGQPLPPAAGDPIESRLSKLEKEVEFLTGSGAGLADDGATGAEAAVVESGSGATDAVRAVQSQLMAVKRQLFSEIETGAARDAHTRGRLDALGTELRNLRKPGTSEAYARPASEAGAFPAQSPGPPSYLEPSSAQSSRSRSTSAAKGSGDLVQIGSRVARLEGRLESVLGDLDAMRGTQREGGIASRSRTKSKGTPASVGFAPEVQGGLPEGRTVSGVLYPADVTDRGLAFEEFSEAADPYAGASPAASFPGASPAGSINFPSAPDPQVEELLEAVKGAGKQGVDTLSRAQALASDTESVPEDKLRQLANEVQDLRKIVEQASSVEVRMPSPLRPVATSQSPIADSVQFVPGAAPSPRQSQLRKLAKEVHDLREIVDRTCEAVERVGIPADQPRSPIGVPLSQPGPLTTVPEGAPAAGQASPLVTQATEVTTGKAAATESATSTAQPAQLQGAEAVSDGASVASQSKRPPAQLLDQDVPGEGPDGTAETLERQASQLQELADEVSAAEDDDGKEKKGTEAESLRRQAAQLKELAQEVSALREAVALTERRAEAAADDVRGRTPQTTPLQAERQQAMVQRHPPGESGKVASRRPTMTEEDRVQQEALRHEAANIVSSHIALADEDRLRELAAEMRALREIVPPNIARIDDIERRIQEIFDAPRASQARTPPAAAQASTQAASPLQGPGIPDQPSLAGANSGYVEQAAIPPTPSTAAAAAVAAAEAASTAAARTAQCHERLDAFEQELRALKKGGGGGGGGEKRTKEKSKPEKAAKGATGPQGVVSSTEQQASSGVGGGAGEEQALAAAEATRELVIPEPTEPTVALGTNAAAVEAVASLAARAAELEEQFESDGESGGGLGGQSEARLARLEGLTSMLARDLDAVQRRLRDQIFGASPETSMAGGAPAGPGASTPGPGAEGLSVPAGGGDVAQKLRGLSMEIQALKAGRGEDEAKNEARAKGIEDNVRSNISRIDKIAAEVRGLREGRMTELASEIKLLRENTERRATTEANANKEARREQKEKLDLAIESLDRKSEDRLASVWKELMGHAETAATRADKLERNLFQRMETSEKQIQDIIQKAKDDEGAKKIAELIKQMEWVNWRISWLEWATNGEKRSFSRPVDAKSVLPSPPPSTITAPGFNQPITEDVELWARQTQGQQRLRRRIQMLPNGPDLNQFAPPSPEHGQRPLGGSRSAVQLPSIVNTAGASFSTSAAAAGGPSASAVASASPEGGGT